MSIFSGCGGGAERSALSGPMLIPPVNIDAGELRRRTSVRDPPELISRILGTEDGVTVGPDGEPGRAGESLVLAGKCVKSALRREAVNLWDVISRIGEAPAPL